MIEEGAVKNIWKAEDRAGGAMLGILRSGGMLTARQAAAAASRRTSTAVLSSLRPLPLPDGERAILQERLGYTFTNHTLLDDALTHTSYPKRPSGGLKFGLTDRPTLRSYKPFKVIGEHTIRDKLESDNPPFLVNLNLSPHKLARTAVRLNLFDSLRHNSPKLDLQVHQFIKEQQGVVPYRGIPPKVPRVLPDLVHAMLGAIVVDCGYQFDLACQKMRLYLEPFFLSEDLKKQETYYTLHLIGKEHDLKPHLCRRRTGPIHTTKVFIKGSLHGSASSTSQSESDFLALLDAINKLPKYMLTGTLYDTPLGVKDKLEPFLGLDHLSLFCC